MGRKVDIDSLTNQFLEEVNNYMSSWEEDDPFITPEQFGCLVKFTITFMERENVQGMIFPYCTPGGFIFRVEYFLSPISIAVEKRPWNVQGNFIDLTS